MSILFRRSPLVAFALLVGAIASAQDSVSIGNCVGDAVSPWDDSTATNGSEQCDTYTVDLAPLTSSWGTEFGIAPIVKTSRSSTAFFNSGMSAQGMSSTLVQGVALPSATYSSWRGAGFGVNNDPLVNNPGTPTSTPLSTNQFGVGFAEFGTTDPMISYNAVVGGIVNVLPAIPGRLYVSRFLGMSNGCSGLDNLAQFGFGGVDSNGDLMIRADGFGTAFGGCGGLANLSSDNYIFRVNGASRDCDIISAANDSFPTGTDALDKVFQSGATVYSTPTLVPSSVTGGESRYLGTNFNGEFVREDGTNSVLATTDYLSGVASGTRGTVSYTPKNWSSAPLLFSSTYGICGLIGTDANGDATVINVWGLDANTDVEATLGLALPPVVTDNATGFADNSGEFDSYHSQVAFRGGNGQIAMGVDQAGRLITAAQADHPADGGSNWPINYIAVARTDPVSALTEWTMAGYNDGTVGAGGTGKPILDEAGVTIGRMVTLDAVTGGAVFGPSVSSPMVDSVGNVWFISGVELFLDAGGSDFDTALLRAVYTPSDFSYDLELIMTVGGEFDAVNSGLTWQLRFLGIADSNSISSGTAFSGNMAAYAHNDQNTAGLDPVDSRTLGGVVINAAIVYDVDNDQDFLTCFNGGNDQNYTSLLYIGHRFWPNLGNQMAGTTAPVLKGEGLMVPGELIKMILEDHIPFSTANLVVGFSQINAPFKGGTLVPDVNLIIPLPTDASGGITLPFPWPAGVFSGFEVTMQTWNVDAGGPKGFSASNAMLLRTP